MTKYAGIVVVMGMLLIGCQDNTGETAQPVIDQEDAKTLDEAAATLDAETSGASAE